METTEVKSCDKRELVIMSEERSLQQNKGDFCRREVNGRAERTQNNIEERGKSH